jgi:cbb3-type cytochrome oxidase subunit 3
MLKFIKHHLTGIHGIEVFPTIAFVLFFGMFLGMLWYVLTMRREHVRELENLPLSDGHTGP